MYKPTVKIPERGIIAHHGFYIPSVVESTTLLSAGTVVPKMGLWERLKYLFTGKISDKCKTGPIEEVPFDIDILKKDIPADRTG